MPTVSPQGGGRRICRGCIGIGTHGTGRTAHPGTGVLTRGTGQAYTGTAGGGESHGITAHGTAGMIRGSTGIRHIHIGGAGIRNRTIIIGMTISMMLQVQAGVTSGGEAEPVLTA